MSKSRRAVVNTIYERLCSIFWRGAPLKERARGKHENKKEDTAWHPLHLCPNGRRRRPWEWCAPQCTFTCAVSRAAVTSGKGPSVYVSFPSPAGRGGGEATLRLELVPFWDRSIPVRVPNGIRYPLRVSLSLHGSRGIGLLLNHRADIKYDTI